MIVLLALILTICGCTGFYLASPNQKWLSKAPPGRPFLTMGSLLLAGGLAAWITALRPLSGIFVTLHVVMVCLFAFPYVATLHGKGRSN